MLLFTKSFSLHHRPWRQEGIHGSVVSFSSAELSSSQRGWWTEHTVKRWWDGSWLAAENQSLWASPGGDKTCRALRVCVSDAGRENHSGVCRGSSRSSMGTQQCSLLCPWGPMSPALCGYSWPPICLLSVPFRDRIIIRPNLSDSGFFFFFSPPATNNWQRD